MTTYLNYTHPIYSTLINDYYNGVLKVSDGTSYGTGSLLYDGKSILTAAHVFDGMSYDNLKIYLYDGESDFTLNARVTVYEGYDDVNINGDLAIVTFDETLDDFYNRYNIFRDDSISRDFTAVGYGDVGTGTTGYIDSSTIHKVKVTNTFDADLNTLENDSYLNLSWESILDSVLVADFDTGNSNQDVIGYLNNTQDLGTGYTEGIIAPGDSGGPSFVNEQIAGIASYSFEYNSANFQFDVNDTLDSSFGEMAAWQSTAYYQEWIDKTIRDNYIDAPITKEDVKQEVSEADTYAYFMVSYNLDRNLINDTISVDYKTLDGTAVAGEDFIAVSGRLNLYSDEDYAIIAVELINDSIKENDEYFYIEISNPVNGSFGEGVETLTAIRTIYDDTVWG